jgi:hypothetical protein
METPPSFASLFHFHQPLLFRIESNQTESDPDQAPDPTFDELLRDFDSFAGTRHSNLGDGAGGDGKTMQALESEMRLSTRYLV